MKLQTSNDLNYDLVGGDDGLSYVSSRSDTHHNPCPQSLTEIDAFLYGLPGGLLFSGILLICFVMFGNALTRQTNNNIQPSGSSNTRVDKALQPGKKNKRGHPPSQELKRVDINQLAMGEDAPDDIKAMVQAGKFAGPKTPALKVYRSKLIASKMSGSKM